MKTATFTKYAHTYFIFEDHPTPAPVIPCAHCGSAMPPDGERPFWMDNETDLIFCSIGCVNHKTKPDPTAHARQSLIFAMLAGRTLGFIA